MIKYLKIPSKSKKVKDIGLLDSLARENLLMLLGIGFIVIVSHAITR